MRRKIVFVSEVKQMRYVSWRQAATLVVILAAATILAQNAAATPMGLLNTDSGAGTVTVTLQAITWATHPNAFVVAGGTTLTSAAGNPAIGSTGDLKDLTFAAGLPVLNFLTFNTVPLLAFDLLSIGPGSSNTNCAGLAVGQSCSVFLGSPFILTLTVTGTSVSLSVGGVAHDGTLPNATYNGIFTTQLVNQTPLQVQQTFGCHTGDTSPTQCTNQNASVTSSHSATFALNAVPEPDTLALMLIGGLFLGGAKLAGRFRRKS
jgi:PEP-CTERM motif